VFRLLFATLAGALLVSSLPAQAEPAADNLVPHTDLNARLFPETEAPERGWKALANVLDALTPSIDTALPLTPSQITQRISTMLDQGQVQQALDVIHKRQAQRQAANELGTDVQLLFLEGRALSLLGQHAQAITLYRGMTEKFPELPEPWNNLAAEYVSQGKIDMAHDALKMALGINPKFALAQKNMGKVLLLQAHAAYVQAAKLGAGGAASQASRLQPLLENQ
jgi:tetratricopeptide (TPR) repeat protein